MIALTSLVLMLSYCRLLEAKECTNLLPNQTEFDVHFWTLYPYTTSNTSDTEGVLNHIFRRLQANSTLKFSMGQENTYREVSALEPGSTNRIAAPLFIEPDDTNPCKVKVYKSTGFAFVVRRNVREPLSQLAGSFISGGQVIGLVLILTGIAGICIWLLDRQRNPENFPKPFITGSWQGFWWAFVTMTTVGYGDLAPKSVPARLFSVLWMLLGLVAFSVLTANFTSSLAREIETDLNLFNKKMAVFKGSIEQKAAIDAGGKFVEYESFDNEMMDALRNKQVEGLLLDKHVAVSSDAIIGKDLTIEIGKMIDVTHYVGFRLIMPDRSLCAEVKKCIEQLAHTRDIEEIMFTQLSNNTLAMDDEKKAKSLFEDYEFFIILIALFSVMTAIGVLWEYFWLKPNIAKQNKSEDIEISRNNLLKYILTELEVKNLCESCTGTIETIYQKDGEARKERLHETNSSTMIDNLIPGNPFKRAKDKNNEPHDV